MDKKQEVDYLLRQISHFTLPHLDPINHPPSTYKHCEYQSFCFWQVQGDSHSNGPGQPMPAHWP